MGLTDRSIRLTGAAGGIGRGLALQLASYARRLTLVGRRAESLEKTADLGRVAEPPRGRCQPGLES